MSTTIDTTTVHLKTKAKFASRIFGTLAWIVLIVGGIAAAATTLSALFMILSGEAGMGFLTLLYLLVIAFTTALYWALITTLTLVVGYIHNRSDV